MKPVFLEFSGLNSYQEPQSIAFDSLGGSGLFGIFGPTGSGKSTVLDAITLALYGRVERSSQRRGILNQDSEKLIVRLTFGLGDALYKVERNYVRNRQDPWAVRNTISRLLHATDDAWEVLADKDGDVNQQIQELLGLSHDDFSRAVVLPQGKFAEFLSLRGAERRQMLQRIFSLEKYGDALNETVKELEGELDSQLRDVQTQLQTIGDASPAAVKKVQDEVAAAKEHLNQQKEAVQVKEKAYYEAKEVRELQRKLDTAQAVWKSVESQRPDFEELEQRLQQAEAAEPYRSTLLEHRNTSQRVIALENESGQLAEGLEETVKALDAAAERKQKAEKKRQEAMPQLVERRESLRQAVEWEEELERLAGAVETVNTKHREAVAQVEQHEQNVLRLETACQEARTQRDALRQRRQELWLPAARRQELSQAAAAAKRVLEYQQTADQWRSRAATLTEERDSLQAARDLVSQTRQELDAEHQRLQRLRTELDQSQVDAQKGEAQRRWAAAFRELVQRGESIHSREDELARRRSQAEAKLATAEREQQDAAVAWQSCVRQYQEAVERCRELERRNRAAAVAVELRSGEPCPVCGSVDHPDPAGESADDWTSAVTEADEKRDAERTAHTQLQTLAERQRQAQSDLVVIGDEQAELNEVLESWRAHLPEALRLQSFADLKRSLAAEERSCEQYFQALKTWTEADQAWRAEYGAYEARRQDLEERTTAVTEKWGTLTARLQSALESLESTEILHANAVRELQQFATAEPQAVLEEYDAYSRQQNELDEVEQQLASVVDQLETTESTLATTMGELQTKRQEMTHLGQQKQQLNDETQQLQVRLQQRTAPFPTVQEALEDVVAEIQQLEADVETAAKEQNTLREQREAAAGDLRAVESQLEIFRDQRLRLEAALAQACTDLNVENPEQLAGALVDEAERRLWRQRLNEYQQERHHAAEDIRSHSAELAGRRVTAESWSDLEAELQESRSQRDKALSKLGALEQGLRDIQERSIQWKDGQAAERRLQKERDTLRELRSVLRGNAFVEYLAERQLQLTAQNASQHLGRLTKYRYALEVDATSGFVMRDDANGGQRRPVHSLSGGETFLTSLALALALSGQIQLRGRYPLEFFFLDEGFGSLDEELLELVITSLERMDTGNMLIGVISHVPELKERIAQKIMVSPAIPGGAGSSLRLHMG